MNPTWMVYHICLIPQGSAIVTFLSALEARKPSEPLPFSLQFIHSALHHFLSWMKLMQIWTKATGSVSSGTFASVWTRMKIPFRRSSFRCTHPFTDKLMGLLVSCATPPLRYPQREPLALRNSGVNSWPCYLPLLVLLHLCYSLVSLDLATVNLFCRTGRSPDGVTGPVYYECFESQL